jgi:hypothetical protein
MNGPQLTRLQAVLERLCADRIAALKDCHEAGQLERAAASAEHADLNQIQRMFAFLVRNAEWIRAEHVRRIDERDAVVDAPDALPSDSAIAVVLDAFPGAIITRRIDHPLEGL